MDDVRRQTSIIRWIGRRQVRDLIGPLALSLFVGGAGTAGLFWATHPSSRVALVGDGLMTLGVLLGVVFAAFALLIALFNNDYVRLISATDEGVAGFMFPFTFALGCEISTILLSMAYRVAAPDLDWRIEGTLFVVWGIAFVFTLFDVLALGKSVFVHGLHRARQIEIEETVPSTDVTHLHKRESK